jgi:hypothetical protein
MVEVQLTAQLDPRLTHINDPPIGPSGHTAVAVAVFTVLALVVT